MKPTPLLQRYEDLLRERAVPLGMISRADAPLLRPRHIDDSLRAMDAFREGDARAYDIGSGAGLPGLVLAIALPDRRFTLIEPRARRAAFLELAVERLELPNVEVVAAPVEEVARRVRAGDLPSADLATARAFAPLERAWPAARSLLGPGGRLVYFAGEGMQDPRGEAERVGGGEATVELLLDSPAPLVIMTLE